MSEPDVGQRQDQAEDGGAARKYTIAVDFDGVIHSYTTRWERADVIPDPPVPGAIEWLMEMSRKFKVVIFTTRGETQAGREAVVDWLIDHGYHPWVALRRDTVGIEVTAVKPPALIYLDDRAVRFDGEHFPTADQIHREYVPWNKRSRSPSSSPLPTSEPDRRDITA